MDEPPGGGGERPDVALLFSPPEEDGSIGIIRVRDGEIEAGRAHMLEEGKPIQGDVLRLTPRADVPYLFDVQVEHEAPRPPRAPGPPKVATERYRRGWDTIFGRRTPPPAPGDSN